MNYHSNTQQSSAKVFENLVTYEQLSERLNVPVNTLRDWVYKRKIPFVKAGRLIRFKISEIERWLVQGG